jgi:hypothetical protein
LPTGTTEIGIHPGRSEAWRRVEFEALANGRATQSLQRAKAQLSSFLDI